jgi:hypothetical protein
MNEAAELAFLMGIIFAGYSKDFLTREAHVDEVLQFHCGPMAPSPEALAKVREIAIKTFCR